MEPRSGKRPTCKCYLGERFILQWEVSSVHSLLDVTNIKADSALFHNARLSLSSAGTWQNDERAKKSPVADKSKRNNFSTSIFFHWCEKCESLVYKFYTTLLFYMAHVHKAAAINMHSLLTKYYMTIPSTVL
jgi:hypothetical protein